MKTLTDEQADLLRRLRPYVRPARAAVTELVSALLTACEHRDEDNPKCWICVLYASLRDAESELHTVPDDLDKALLMGPHPNRKGRRQ